MWPAPMYDLKFAVASGDRPSDLPRSICYHYGTQHNENNYTRRLHLESLWEPGGIIIADDDPGEIERRPRNQWPRYLHQKYHSTPPTACFRARNRTGISRPVLPPDQVAFLWSVLERLGSRIDTAYAGFSASTQSQNRDRVNRPYLLDAVVSGAALVLAPMRHLVPKHLQKNFQEWATASATSIANGKRTLTLRSMIAKFDVQPPKEDPMVSIRRIHDEWPMLIQLRNSTRVRSNQKTGCIMTLDTQTIVRSLEGIR
jgi:hypothetical protein